MDLQGDEEEDAQSKNHRSRYDDELATKAGDGSEMLTAISRVSVRRDRRWHIGVPATFTTCLDASAHASTR
jgi:hypothetical protein